MAARKPKYEVGDRFELDGLNFEINSVAFDKDIGDFLYDVGKHFTEKDLQVGKAVFEYPARASKAASAGVGIINPGDKFTSLKFNTPPGEPVKPPKRK